MRSMTLFGAGSMSAQNAYALAYRAVVEPSRRSTPLTGCALFFDAWRREGSMDRAMRSAYG
jgi:hypothetical protein